MAYLKLVDQKLIGIELLRFGCALSILVWHYQHFFFDGDSLAAKIMFSELPFYSFLHPLYDFGLLAVQWFWQISGYIFFRKYRRQIASRAISGWSFFILRFSRLYPLHLMTLLLVTGLQSIFLLREGHYFVYQFNESERFLLHLLFASNWFTDVLSFNGPVWSVSVEVLAYFIFFISLRMKAGARSLLGRVLFVLILGILYRNRSELGIRNLENILQCLVCFFWGGLVYDLERRFNYFVNRFLKLQTATRIAMFLAFVTFSFITIIAASKWKTEIHWWSIWLIAPALTLFWTNIIFSEIKITWPNWLVEIGNLTYASYLIHFPIELLIVLILGTLGESIWVMINPIYFLLYMAAILIVSGLVFRFFEKPAQIAIRRWKLTRQL